MFDNQIVRITKEFSFEMSHLLKNHLGLCKNIHGHSYKLFVTLSGQPSIDKSSPKLGMLMDFGDLKSIVNQSIIAPLDHALMVSESTFRGSFLEKYDGKIVVLPFEPTCENIVLYFASILEPQMPMGVRLKSLKLFETASCYCEWYLDDNV